MKSRGQPPANSPQNTEALSSATHKELSDANTCVSLETIRLQFNFQVRTTFSHPQRALLYCLNLHHSRFPSNPFPRLQDLVFFFNTLHIYYFLKTWFSFILWFIVTSHLCSCRYLLIYNSLLKSDFLSLNTNPGSCRTLVEQSGMDGLWHSDTLC